MVLLSSRVILCFCKFLEFTRNCRVLNTVGVYSVFFVTEMLVPTLI